MIWWLIPVGAVTLTLLYFGWKFRPRKTPKPDAGIKQREKLREAMSRPLPQSRQ